MLANTSTSDGIAPDSFQHLSNNDFRIGRRPQGWCDTMHRGKRVAENVVAKASLMSPVRVHALLDLMADDGKRPIGHSK